jgi:hypothetical protein
LSRFLTLALFEPFGLLEQKNCSLARRKEDEDEEHAAFPLCTDVEVAVDDEEIDESSLSSSDDSTYNEPSSPVSSDDPKSDVIATSEMKQTLKQSQF